MVSSRHDPQAAPGDLERVRGLLNSWSIPDDMRKPTDDFDVHVATLGVTSPAEAAQLRQLRDDLRAVVERAPDAEWKFNAWLDRLEVRPVVEDGAVSFRHQAGLPGDILVAVLEAVLSGSCARLKACPDCRWVFFDHSRNGSKRWCLMTAGGPEGRSCGSIAKVKRYRERHKQAKTGEHT